MSSKMAGGAFRRERATAVRTIERFPHLQAWAWERDATAGPYYSEPECIGHARTSDALVLILDDELTPVTRKEYNAASRRSAHCIILMRHGSKRSREVESFVRRVRRHAITAPFGNLSELESQLFNALRAFSVRPAREQRQLRDTRESRAYESNGIGLVERDGSFRPITEVVEEARSLAADGREHERALELLWGLADDALDAGLVTVARDLLRDLREIIPPTTLEGAREAWVLNSEGRVFSQQERTDEARPYFERMRQIGRATGDTSIVSTALQNLGVLSVIDRDWERARLIFDEVLRLKVEDGDRYAATQVVLNQVNAMSGLGRFDEAHRLLDEADRMVRQMGGAPNLRASIDGQRALLYVNEGRPEDARLHMLRGLRTARRAQSPDRVLTALRNLAKFDADHGRPNQGVRWYEKAVDLANAMDTSRREAMVRRPFGMLLHSLGRNAEAAEQFLLAAALDEEDGDRYHEAESYGNAAVCLCDAGRLDEAKLLLERAVQSSAELGDERTASFMGELAAVQAEIGLPSDAVTTAVRAANLTSAWTDRVRFFRDAAAYALEVPSLASKAHEYLEMELACRRCEQTSVEWAEEAAQMGAMLTHTSQSVHARHFFTQALRVFARRKDHQRVFATRNDRAIAAAENGGLRSALVDLKASLLLAGRLRDRALLLQAHLNLSEIYRRSLDEDQAMSHATSGLRVARRLRDRRGEADALITIARCYLDRNDSQRASGLLEKSRVLARRAGSVEAAAGADILLAGLDYGSGRPGRAAQRYRAVLHRLGEEDAHPRLIFKALRGVTVSDAALGRVDEKLVQKLVRLAEDAGYYAEARDALFQASESLMETGNPKDAADLAALVMLFGMHPTVSPNHLAEALAPLVELLRLARTLRQAGFRRRLRSELRRHMGTPFASEVFVAADEALAHASPAA